MTNPKYGPPPHKARPYNSMLEMLETQANKKLTSEYSVDLTRAMSTFEIKTQVNPAMVDLQPELQWFMRPFLLDFLVELHSSFKLQPQTLFLCLNIMDRYCSKRIVFKRHYQLVGCTALWIAGKYEDKKLRIPTLKDLTLMCRSAYDEEMFIQMEMHILSTLDWNLVHPNLEDCLQLAIEHSNIVPSTPNKDTHRAGSVSTTLSAVTVVARFLCEISLYERFFLTVPASLVAITANLLACSILQIPNGSESLRDLLKSAMKKKSHSRRLVKRSRSTLYEGDRTHNKYDDDFVDFSENETDEMDDLSSDEDDLDSNAENKSPEIFGAFLSGLDDNAIQMVKKIALMFIIQLSKVTEVLSRKYENLGVIQVINNFHQRFKFVIASIYENQELIVGEEIAEIDPTVAHLADLILQFPELETEEEVQTDQDDSDGYCSANELTKPSLSLSLDDVPVTPPSASSQYSIFSNKRGSSMCNTPIHAVSYGDTIPLKSGKLRIYKSKHYNSGASLHNTNTFYHSNDSHSSLTANPPSQLQNLTSNSSTSSLQPPPTAPFHTQHRREFSPLAENRTTESSAWSSPIMHV